MDILVINTVDYAYNGITSVIRNYYLNMNREGIKTDFVVINHPPKELKQEIEENGDEIFVIPRKNPLRYMWNLWKLVREKNYHVAHIHGNSATMSFELFPLMIGGVPKRIVSSHNTTCEHRILHKVLYPFFCYAYTDALACGEQAGKWLFGRRKFAVLKNGILLDQYSYQEEVRVQVRKELTLDEEEFLIGHVGLFNNQKNQSYLIKVMKGLREKKSKYKLLLIGTGEYQENVRNLVEEEKLSDYIIFLGQTDQVWRYLQAMDVFVLPSLHEGLPVVAVEAQAAGLPCVFSNLISTETSIGSDVVFLPLSEDAQNWCEEIETIKTRNRKLRSVENIHALTKAGYSIVENANQLRTILVDKME